MPQATLQLLRRFWPVHGNPVLMFPNRSSGRQGAAAVTTPLDPGGVQNTLHKVITACGLKKKGSCALSVGHFPCQSNSREH
jgi:integrase/recombinase XerD